LDDISASPAADVHLAAMGSLWQALAHGFAGLRPGKQTLRSIRGCPARGGRWSCACAFARRGCACGSGTSGSRLTPIAR
jgi:trehalose/maltose hydrolase-like predicted phosphorylase